MEMVQRMIKEIKESKWVKNNLSAKEHIYSKILIIDSDLYLLIKCNKSEHPILAKVEAIKSVYNDFFIYYDGELNEYIIGDEYDKIKDKISKSEWELINKHNWEEALEENNLLSEDGYYIDLHANYKVNEDGKDKEILEEIKNFL